MSSTMRTLRTIIDGQDLHDHPLIVSGAVELADAARSQPFPRTTSGAAGSTNDPQAIADRVKPRLENPRRSGMLHLMGFGALTTGLGHAWDDQHKAAPLEAFVEGIADDELLLHPYEVEWSKQLSDRLGDHRPTWIHLDNEKHLDAGNIYDATKDQDSNAFWNLLRTSRRAMDKIGARSPELAELIMDPRPWMSDTPGPNDRWRRFMVLWSRYARRLCTDAIDRMLHISGLTVQRGLMEPVVVTGYLYYDGDDGAVNEDGWPIRTTTLDGVTSNYGFYGDKPSQTRLYAKAAMHARGGPEHFVPILRLSDDPTVMAHRLKMLDGMGVQRAILYAPDGVEACAANLTNLHDLGAL